ncbi:MAG TPA: CPXCG motif-containing cysteine-rich protein [Lysobacter sp.]|nr:CPXCG motif-containing cysteine-rich protein [Lysobacter sp.]
MLPSIPTQCPCCGEPIDLLVDDSIEQQDYTEDCAVCCRPLRVTVVIVDGDPQVNVSAENG